MNYVNFSYQENFLHILSDGRKWYHTSVFSPMLEFIADQILYFSLVKEVLLCTLRVFHKYKMFWLISELDVYIHILISVFGHSFQSMLSKTSYICKWREYYSTSIDLVFMWFHNTLLYTCFSCEIYYVFPQNALRFFLRAIAWLMVTRD